MRGETVTVKRRLFRGKLYPAGLAVYASPENLEKFAKESEVRKTVGKKRKKCKRDVGRAVICK